MTLSKEENTAATLKPVQYSVRSLLVVMGFVAILAAVAGHFYRRCSPESQPYLLILWGSFSLAIACYFWPYERQRLKRCAGSGKCLIRLPSVSFHFWASSNVVNWGGFSVFCFAAFMLISQSSQCEQMASQGSSYPSTAARGTGIGMYVLMGLFAIRAGNEVRLCENGILNKELILWKDISSITPNLRAEHDDRRIYSIKGNPTFRVPPELREQVDALIAEKLTNG